MDLLKRIAREFFTDLRGTALLARENKIFFLASGVAFFAVFSLCPFMIVSFLASRVLLRTVSSVDDAPQQLSTVIKGVLPSLDPKIAGEVLDLLKQNTATGIVNLLILIWCAYELFRAMNYAFEHISVEGRMRNAVWENVVAGFSFLVVVSISTFLLFVTTADISSLKSFFQFESWSLTSFKIFVGITCLVSVLGGITIVFKIMPTERIGWGFAFLGSLLFFLMFIFGRSCFAVYGEQYRALNQPFYGPFVTFIMVSVWIYYLSFIFLFSAQYAIYLESERKV